jgi:hypothetical protein
MTVETSHATNLGRVHARRLRDLYRSAGWPSQDKVEVELLTHQHEKDSDHQRMMRDRAVDSEQA